MKKEKEHFVIVNNNGKRAKQIWEIELDNLTEKEKEEMAEEIKKRYQEKINKDNKTEHK